MSLNETFKLSWLNGHWAFSCAWSYTPACACDQSKTSGIVVEAIPCTEDTEKHRYHSSFSIKIDSCLFFCSEGIYGAGDSQENEGWVTVKTPTNKQDWW